MEDREDSEEMLESEDDRKGGISTDCKEVRLFGILLCFGVYDR